MRRRWRIGTGVALALLCSAAAGFAAHQRPHYLPKSGSVPGLRIAGAELKPGTDIERTVRERARELEQRSVTIQLPDRAVSATLAELGLSVHHADMIRRASSVGRSGSIATRLHDLRRARRRAIDVPLSFDIDRSVLIERLARAKTLSDRPARPARLDLANDRVIEHRDGRYIDVDRTADALRAAVLAGETNVRAVELAIAPRVSTELVRGLDRSVTVSEFSTRFSRFGDSANRAQNIEVAASRISGIVLAPGDVVSFNEVVGARTLDNGFRESWEIYRGEMVRGVGGGTCQVSSTLHAAAFYGGLNIVERYPHSRPSAYIGLGLDATVSWPTVDFKLENRWDFPIVIDARVDGGTITVELLGSHKPAEVAFQREILDIIDYDRKITESRWLAADEIIRKQKGIRGYRIRRTRRIAPVAGEERVEITIDHYPPTREHYIVPAGSDPAELLPPLPGEEPPSESAAGAQNADDSGETAAASAPAIDGALARSGEREIH